MAPYLKRYLKRIPVTQGVRLSEGVHTENTAGPAVERNTSEDHTNRFLNAESSSSNRALSAGGLDAYNPAIALDKFFQVPWDFYFKEELLELSNILNENGMHEWAQTPALYLILKRLGQPLQISAFIASGLSDSSLALPKDRIGEIFGDINSELVEKFMLLQEAVIDNNKEKYEARLQDYINSGRGEHTTPLEDLDFQQISRILKLLGLENASRDPKLYFVLRLVEQDGFLKTFQNKRYGDFHFPYAERQLKGVKLPLSAMRGFLDKQELVCNMQWTEEVHMNFTQDEQNWIKEVKPLAENEEGTVIVDHIMYTGTRSHYARKRVLRSIEGLKLFANEMHILKSVKHDHCIKLVTSYTDPDWMAIISHPVADMNLQALLEVSSLAVDRKQLMQSFFGCLSTALTYLHSSEIRHKDIKPENILIHSNRVLLADFGISADRINSTNSISRATPRYSAPEVDEGRSPTLSSDVFSLGCVFLEIFARMQDITSAALIEYMTTTGQLYKKYSTNLVAARQWIAERMTQQHSALQDDVLDILRPCFLDMLAFDPSKRPSAKTIMGRLGTKTLPKIDAYGRCCALELQSASSPRDRPDSSSAPTLNPIKSHNYGAKLTTDDEPLNRVKSMTNLTSVTDESNSKALPVPEKNEIQIDPGSFDSQLRSIDSATRAVQAKDIPRSPISLPPDNRETQYDVSLYLNSDEAVRGRQRQRIRPKEKPEYYGDAPIYRRSRSPSRERAYIKNVEDFPRYRRDRSLSRDIGYIEDNTAHFPYQEQRRRSLSRGREYLEWTNVDSRYRDPKNSDGTKGLVGYNTAAHANDLPYYARPRSLSRESSPRSTSRERGDSFKAKDHFDIDTWRSLAMDINSSKGKERRQRSLSPPRIIRSETMPRKDSKDITLDRREYDRYPSPPPNLFKDPTISRSETMPRKGFSDNIPDRREYDRYPSPPPSLVNRLTINRAETTPQKDFQANYVVLPPPSKRPPNDDSARRQRARERNAAITSTSGNNSQAQIMYGEVPVSARISNNRQAQIVFGNDPVVSRTSDNNKSRDTLAKEQRGKFSLASPPQQQQQLPEQSALQRTPATRGSKRFSTKQPEKSSNALTRFFGLD